MKSIRASWILILGLIYSCAPSPQSEKVVISNYRRGELHHRDTFYLFAKETDSFTEYKMRKSIQPKLVGDYEFYIDPLIRIYPKEINKVFFLDTTAILMDNKTYPLPSGQRKVLKYFHDDGIPHGRTNVYISENGSLLATLNFYDVGYTTFEKPSNKSLVQALIQDSSFFNRKIKPVN